MSFQQGLSGLNAASKNLDVIGNNVANSSTIGFKGSEAHFADVYANSQFGGGGGGETGIGTSISAVVQTIAQGNLKVTSTPLDVAINGNGFFRLSDAGAVTYSRNGQFQLDKNGYIVSDDKKNLTGYPATSNGTITTAAPVNLQVSTADLAPLATSTTTAGVNLDSRKASLLSSNFSLTDASTYQGATSMSVYDSLGNAHTLSMYFVKTAANSWDVFSANDGVQVGTGPVGSIGFNTNGSVSSAPTIGLTVPVTTGAKDMVLTLDLGSSTQFGSDFGVNQISQNGYGAGKLSGFVVGGDGLVMGRYSNGQTRAQGQIALTNFTNPQGLQALGANQWAESGSSGPPLTSAPGTGNLGVLQSGALESSNVDLTAELVDLITAQRVYQANAQTIKTQDSVLQTLVNLR